MVDYAHLNSYASEQSKYAYKLVSFQRTVAAQGRRAIVPEVTAEAPAQPSAPIQRLHPTAAQHRQLGAAAAVGAAQ